MYPGPGHYSIDTIYAAVRSQDMLADAARDRQIAEARAARSIQARDRAPMPRALGDRLARAGARVLGVL